MASDLRYPRLRNGSSGREIATPLWALMLATVWLDVMRAFPWTMAKAAGHR